MSEKSARWDIFCKVVDNYGDIGVSWRLARQLAKERGLTIRLWVDDLSSFRRLVPEIRTGERTQLCRNIEVRHWLENFESVEAAEIPDVVIEAFGCALPETYIAAMARCTEMGRSAPVWINLEYLSAEPWVETHHGLASPHPRLPLTKYFFFPGFTSATGGLLCEADLQQRREAFQNEAAAQSGFWEKLGLNAPIQDEQRISMFVYESPETESLFLRLLELWSADNRPRMVLIPEGVLTQALVRFFEPSLPMASTLQRGNLTVQIFAFLDQDDYDRLLWACDVNFVRGEDSFVRAQWAGKPFVWHIYPQAENVHFLKLEAFLDLYTQDWPAQQSGSVREFWKGWNRVDILADAAFLNAWQAFEREFQALDLPANNWANRINQSGDLAFKLQNFAESIYKAEEGGGVSRS